MFSPFFQIKDIKDGVEYYIENCREPDFMDDDMLYDEIDGLEEMLLEVNVRILRVIWHVLPKSLSVYDLFCFLGPPSVAKFKTESLFKI